MLTCCGRNFCDKLSLGQHQRAKCHYFCKQCNRAFHTSNALQQHTRDSHNWQCGHCNAVFRAQEKLAQHQRSTGHCYCRDCSRFFVHNNALRQHISSSHHSLRASHFHCCDCDRDFGSEQALEQHLANKIHTIRRQTSAHVCKECNREFGSGRALQQHRASVVHHPLSDIRCIAGSSGRRGCQRRFSSPSALLHHLESGACPSGVTRHKLNAMVQSNDVDHIISSSKNVISGLLMDSPRRQQTASSFGTEPATPSDSCIVFTPRSSISSSNALSPQILTPQSDYFDTLTIVRPVSPLYCPLCPATRRPFLTLESLQQHLCSLAHTYKMFHCPVSFFPASAKMTRKSFSTLSGLAQHLESGACGGGKATFRKSAKYIEGRLRELGLTGVKLLM